MLVLSSLYRLSHYSFISFLCFIIPTTPVHGGGDRELDWFLKCNNTRYDCGDIRNVGYPFSGGDRPAECGHPSFHLKCNGDRNETTFVIGPQSFCVFEIDKLSPHTMKIARTDLLDHECPRNGTEFTSPDGGIGGGLFAFFPDMVNATLHMGRCHFPPADAQSSDYLKLTFECNRTGGVATTVTVLFPGLGASAVKCDDDGNVIRVPISKVGLLEELERNNTSANVLDLLSQGITIWYNESVKYCVSCENSGGVCWSNTSLGEPTCLCRHRIFPYFCGYEDHHGLGRRTRLLIGDVSNLAAVPLPLDNDATVLLEYLRCSIHKIDDSYPF